MIVDVALKLERDQGLSPLQAAVKASHQRLRPILMTTFCAFFGGIPLIASTGAGSEFRQPLGIAIVFMCTWIAAPPAATGRRPQPPADRLSRSRLA